MSFAAHLNLFPFENFWLGHTHPLGDISMETFAVWPDLWTHFYSVAKDLVHLHD